VDKAHPDIGQANPLLPGLEAFRPGFLDECKKKRFDDFFFTNLQNDK